MRRYTPDGAPVYDSLPPEFRRPNPKAGFRPRIVTPIVDAEWQAGRAGIGGPAGAPGARTNVARPVPAIPGEDQEEAEPPRRLHLNEARYSGALAYPSAQLWGTPAAEARVSGPERRAFLHRAGPDDRFSVYDPAATVPLNSNLGISMTPQRPVTYLDAYRAAETDMEDTRVYSRFDPSLIRDNVPVDGRVQPPRVRGGRTDAALFPGAAPPAPNYETDAGVRASTDQVYASPVSERYGFPVPEIRRPTASPLPLDPQGPSFPPRVPTSLPDPNPDGDDDEDGNPDPLLEGDPRLTFYGDAARAYQDEMLGNVQYYYRDVDPYQRPNFTIRNNVDHVDFTDPMGTTRPEYHQAYSLEDVRAVSEEAFHRDQLMIREDRMNQIMLRMNQRSWQTRMAPLRRDAFSRS